MSDSIHWGEAHISEKENSRTSLSLAFVQYEFLRYHMSHYKKEQVEQLVTKIERNVAFVWQCRNGAGLSFVLFEKIHFISYNIIRII